MNNNTIITLTLLAASGSAFAETGVKKSDLVYDRVGLAYSSGSSLNAWELQGTALLNDSFLIGGRYQDIKLKGYGKGNGAGLDVGYKFAAGPGDVILSLGYGQAQVSGANNIINTDRTDIGVAWRQQISKSFEYRAAYTYAMGDTLVGTHNLGAGTTSLSSAKANLNLFAFQLRYNFSNSLDLTAGYTFSSKSSNFWSLSAGYNF
jgi:hypothetical protein